MADARRRVGDALRRARASFGAGGRRRIAVKDAEIAALRKELARTRGDGTRPEVGGTPVFFVLGQQKSGTTWLMRMLDSHPEILCRGEGRFFGEHWRRETVRRTDAKRPPSTLHNALLDAEYLRLWIERSVWTRDDDPDEHLDNLLRLTVDYFLAARLSGTGKRLVGDKSPLLEPGTIGEISRVYPEAPTIHIIRDGRDAAVSAAHHARNFGRPGKRPRGETLFDEDGLRKLAADWAARVGRTVEDGPKLLGDRYTEVRYEHLLERPEKEVRRLLDLLGAASDEKAVRRCVGSASFERLSKGRERGQEDATSFFRKGVAGDWREAFTERDRRVFKEEAGDVLVRLGYEKDGDW